MVLRAKGRSVGYVPVLLYKDDPKKQLILPQWLKKDAVWNAWMKDVPDLTPASYYERPWWL